MTEVLRTWVLSLTCTALLCSLAMALIPRGRVRTATRLVCGLALAFALLSPLADLDLTDYALDLSRYRRDLAERQQTVGEANDRLARAIIEEESAAYIWDKAQGLGLTVRSVTVRATWGDAQQLWVPYETTMDLDGDSALRARLSREIEAELGIPAQRQKWSAEDEA